MSVDRFTQRPAVHGFIYQYSCNSGSLDGLRRWAFVDGESLFLFPDSVNSSLCYRIFLRDTEISVTDELDYAPWISISEKNTANYVIKPVKANDFEKWLSALILASKVKPLASNRTGELGLAPNFEGTSGEVNQIGDVQGADLAQNNALDVPLSQVTCHHPSNCPDTQGHPISADKINPSSPSLRNSSRHFSLRKERGFPLFDFKTPGNETHPVPPPRPPRSLGSLQSIKEHALMKDGELVVTKRTPGVSRKYPDSGLAKRMSVSASDFHGKSRDELMLLLLQLNREKANLQRWRKYFLQRLQVLSDPNNGASTNEEEISAIQVELNDVTGQLALSEPLVAFLSNMLRMGDLYGGDDTLFASEYKKHLLHDHELVPSKSGLTFARDLEAREIARALNASVSQVNVGPTVQPTSTNNLMRWLDTSQESLHAQTNNINMSTQSLNQCLPRVTFQETAEKRRQRLRLESELTDLENICQPHEALHNRLRDVQKSLRQVTTPTTADPVVARTSYCGPSAALLSRLQPSHERRRASRSNDQLHSLNAADRLTMSRSKDRMQQGTEKNIVRSENICLPSGSSRLHRFRSIPENLNVVTQSADDGMDITPIQQQHVRSSTGAKKQRRPRPEPPSSVQEVNPLQPHEDRQVRSHFGGDPACDNPPLTASLRRTSEIPPRTKERTPNKTVSNHLCRPGVTQGSGRSLVEFNDHPSEAFDETTTEELSLDDTAVNEGQRVNKKMTDNFRPNQHHQGFAKPPTPNGRTLQSWRSRQLL